MFETATGRKYSTETYTKTITVQEYLAGFRDAAACLASCEQCRNFRNRWGCPPFDFDSAKLFSRYENITVIATRITPQEEALPLDCCEEFLVPEKVRMEDWLLMRERETGGLACGLAGRCRYCQGEPCTRPEGKPCRHPDKVRPSLESHGFDITKTLDELFGIRLQWGRDGQMPPYLMLVAALLF